MDNEVKEVENTSKSNTDKEIGEKGGIIKKEAYVKKGSKRFLAGNPGRPRGIKNKEKAGYDASDLMNAIELVEKQMVQEGHKGFRFLVHAIQRAVKSDKIMVSILKKMLPDLTQVTGDSTKNIVIIQTTQGGNNGLKEAETILKARITADEVRNG